MMYPGSDDRRHARGFTLTELMVSVALVVVLMLAVTQIFTITSKTIGGSQAVSAALRDAQAVEGVMKQDLANAAADGACFVIRNVRRATPRNMEDAKNMTSFSTENALMSEDYNQDGKINIDDQIYPSSPAQTYSPLQYNHRNHRTDFLMFCARGVFPRLTSNPNRAVAEMTSREAVIFYHHLQLPADDSGTLFIQPGVHAGAQMPWQNNPHNFFSSQWVLGRVAMLMVNPTAAGRIFDRSAGPTPSTGSYADQNFYPGDLSANPNAPDKRYPFRADSTPLIHYTSDPASETRNYLQDARYDLIGESLAAFRYQLDRIIALNPNQPWYLDYMCSGNTRFNATHYLDQPVDSYRMSKTVPIFLPACSQFIVEFAGDFVTQDWDPIKTTGAGAVDPPDSAADRADPRYGRVIAFVPDGKIDTVYDSRLAPPAALPAGSWPYKGQIRWYGLPRDTNNDGNIVADDGDVVPVRDITGAQMIFEKIMPTSPSATPIPTRQDYMDPSTMTAGTLNYNPSAIVTSFPQNAANIDPQYTVAWGPSEMGNSNISKPRLIRITFSIDRPEAEGKLPDGQLFEYVFKVGQ